LKGLYVLIAQLETKPKNETFPETLYAQKGHLKKSCFKVLFTIRDQIHIICFKRQTKQGPAGKQTNASLFNKKTNILTRKQPIKQANNGGGQEEALEK